MLRLRFQHINHRTGGAHDRSSSRPATRSEKSVRDRLGDLLIPVKLPQPVNPELLKHDEERAESAQNRVADAITTVSLEAIFQRPVTRRV
jgi:hypothetical protein